MLQALRCPRLRCIRSCAPVDHGSAGSYQVRQQIIRWLNVQESVKDVQKQTGGRPVVELEDAEETERDTGSDFEEDLNTGRDQADEHNAESGKGLPQTNGRDLSEGTSPPRKLKPFKRKRGGEAEQ
jgi:hypothetical protein